MCFHSLYNMSHMSPYYMNEEGEDNPFICSSNKDNGMLPCSKVPPLMEGVECTLNASPLGHAYSGLDGTGNSSCFNWNQYYTECKPGELNPHKGAVNFDNIGYAWIAIFQVSCSWNVVCNPDHFHVTDGLFVERFGNGNALVSVIVLFPKVKGPSYSKDRWGFLQLFITRFSSWKDKVLLSTLQPHQIIESSLSKCLF